MSQNNAGTGLTYRGAGVDIDAGDALVENIKPLARRTLRVVKTNFAFTVVYNVVG